ncbi:MAG: agmatine deiminase family protein [Hyphomonadaceae bacterium]
MPQNVSIPAEWAPRKALWTAWPSDASLWKENLAPAREEFAGMVGALAMTGERVRVLASGAEAVESARAALPAGVEIVPQAFGDIWLRDTGPIFAKRGAENVAFSFRFNGWGGKYVLDHDDEVAAAVAAKAEVPLIAHDFVLEGGAIEMDGEGTLLTTRQCLLNENRNPGWTEAEAERVLKAALGVEKILWLDEGLANDHTDGHIDNLARFVAPGIVVCQYPVDDDPNADVLDEIALTLAAMTDAQGRTLEVRRVASPGRVLSAEGDVMAASHMNFIICGDEQGNRRYVAPAYNATFENADLLMEFSKALEPGSSRSRDDSDPGDDAADISMCEFVVSFIASNAILTGGGSFHCITQQEPA